jgi:hypothetical protein
VSGCLHAQAQAKAGVPRTASPAKPALEVIGAAAWSDAAVSYLANRLLAARRRCQSVARTVAAGISWKPMSRRNTKRKSRER